MGPFGPVWLAEPIGRSRAQVLVSFLDGGEDTASVVEALEDRLARTDGLRHPFISEDLGVQPVDGRPALVGEAVEGCSLASIIAQAMLPTSVACDVARKIARALHAAWDRVPSGEEAPFGLVHGDLMPHHVWVGRVAGQGGRLALRPMARRSPGMRLATGFPGRRRGRHRSRGRGCPPRCGCLRPRAIFAHMLSGSPPTDSAGRRGACVGRGSVAEQVRAATGDGALAELVVWCLAFDPSDRPTAQEVETHLDQVRKAHRRPRLPAWCEAEVPRLRAAAQAVFDSPRRANQTVIDRADELPPPPPPPAPLLDEEATAPTESCCRVRSADHRGREERRPGDRGHGSDRDRPVRACPLRRTGCGAARETHHDVLSIRGEYVGEVHGQRVRKTWTRWPSCRGPSDAWRGGRTSARDGESVDVAAARAGRGKESTPDESTTARRPAMKGPGPWTGWPRVGRTRIRRRGLGLRGPGTAGRPHGAPAAGAGRGREDGPARVSEQALARPARGPGHRFPRGDGGARPACSPTPSRAPDPRASRRAAGPPGASESDERRGPGLYLAGIGPRSRCCSCGSRGSGDGPDAQSSRVPSPTDASASTASTLRPLRPHRQSRTPLESPKGRKPRLARQRNRPRPQKPGR